MSNLKEVAVQKTNKKNIIFVLSGIAVLGLLGLYFRNKNKNAKITESKETFDLKTADTNTESPIETQTKERIPIKQTTTSQILRPLITYIDYPIERIMSPIMASQSVLMLKSPLPNTVKVGDRVKIVTIKTPNIVIDTSYVRIKKITNPKVINVSKMLNVNQLPSTNFAIRIEKNS